MLTKRIAGTTHCLGAPSDWDASHDAPCGTLPIRVLVDEDGRNMVCESAWEPTPDELAALNAGGQVVLRVAGGQPPVALYVEPPPTED